MCLNCGGGEDSWESLEQQGDPTSTSERKSVLSIHWKDWCWSRNSNTLATWWEELTHLKRSWCWERLKAGGEGDDRGWYSSMASPTQWTWVWVSSRSWWWTGRPVVLQSMGSQRVRHDGATQLNWKEQMKCCTSHSVLWWEDLTVSRVFLPGPQEEDDASGPPLYVRRRPRRFDANIVDIFRVYLSMFCFHHAFCHLSSSC